MYTLLEVDYSATIHDMHMEDAPNDPIQVNSYPYPSKEVHCSGCVNLSRQLYFGYVRPRQFSVFIFYEAVTP